MSPPPPEPSSVACLERTRTALPIVLVAAGVGIADRFPWNMDRLLGFLTLPPTSAREDLDPPTPDTEPSEPNP
jgi:hypothetical protein